MQRGCRSLREAIGRAATGKFVRYEAELQGAGNTTILVDFSIKPVFDPEGKVLCSSLKPAILPKASVPRRRSGRARTGSGEYSRMVRSAWR